MRRRRSIASAACAATPPARSIGLGDLTDFAGPAPLVQLGQTALDPRNDPEQGRAHACADPAFSIACPATNAKRFARRAFRSSRQVIEPLKAKAAALVPGMAQHALALRAIVAARGRVDPGALVLRVQGLRAFSNICRAFCACWCGARSIRSRLCSCGRPPPQTPRGAFSVGCAHEICLLPRLFGAQHVCGTQCGDPSRRAQAGTRTDCNSNSATCTGARELRAIDPAGFYTLNVRILALAEREGLPLMTICNTCTLNVLDAHAAFVSDAELARTVNARLAEEGLHYSGRTRSATSCGCCTRRSARNGCASWSSIR